MEPILSKEERESMLVEREKRLEQQYKTGKIIVTVIALTYIIFTIISSIISFNILGLVINISAAVALFFGVKWVRVYFVISVGLGSILFLVILFDPALLAQMPGWAIALSAFQTIFGIISSVLLFKSKSVIEFMEYQKESPS